MATTDPDAGRAPAKGKGDEAAADIPGGDGTAAHRGSEIHGDEQHRAASRLPRASRAVSGKAAASIDAETPGREDMRLRDLALAGLGWSSRDALTAAERAPEAVYLLEHVTSAGAGAEWVAALTALLARPAPADRILVELARDLKLQPIEVIAVALAAAVEDDMMVGRALAYLQAPVGGSRPTMGLLHSAFAALAPAGVLSIDVISNGAAVRSGLLTVSGDASPRPERTVAVPLPLCMALSGVESTWPGTTLIDPLEACPLPQSVIDAANKHAGRLKAGSSQVLALRGGSLHERRTVAAAVATAADRKPVVLADEKGGAAAGFAFAGFGVWARLCQLLPVLSWELAPGEVRTVPQFPGYEGPMIALNGPDGNVTNDAGTVLTWTLAAPQREEREALWRTALGDADLAAELARVHRHRAGRIAHLANLARQGAALDKRDAITREDLASAAWITEGVALDALAQPLATPVPDAALVVTPQLRADLNDLFVRCNARDALAAGLGPSIAARYHPGVKALFCGPSGSGKTLTAGWLATRLGIPLYRVDLASMTSKYIGETEKNLAQLLARAEEGEVMLLFDEADSLFGKRTEVKESNDRFANAQTNYLLQRIESFDGIALLTSNSRSRFDAAFMRRLDVVIDFPLPGPEQRRALWLSHLGSAHGLTQQELNQISASADLAGGHIRNAVVTAAVRAAGRAITFNDVAHGIAAEYRKLGKQMPSSLMVESRQSP